MKLNPHTSNLRLLTGVVRKNMTNQRKKRLSNLWEGINQHEIFLIFQFFIPYNIMVI